MVEEVVQGKLVQEELVQHTFYGTKVYALVHGKTIVAEEVDVLIGEKEVELFEQLLELLELLHSQVTHYPVFNFDFNVIDNDICRFH